MFSILIAVRNEAYNLPFLFESLKKLENKNVEILFGNDVSTDQSANLIMDFIQKNPQLNVHLYHISHNIFLTKGKANVLAQLAHKAKGDIFLYTDADMEVSAKWIESFEIYFEKNEKLGIISGVTIPKITNFFSGYQMIEWSFALAVIWLFSWFKIPITAMGNNMAIRKNAYLETGGYEKMPFSVVEDYAIFWEIIKNKWHFLQLYTAKNLSYTQAIPTWNALLHQRNRWLRGAMDLGWWFRILLFVQFLGLPILGLLGIFLGKIIFWQIFFGIILLKWIIIFFALFTLRKIKLLVYLPVYEVCNFFFNLHLLVFYFSKKEVIWKERKF